MPYHRQVNAIIIKEEAQKRIDNNKCPSCGKPKEEWTRRTDWRCCSVECTDKFQSELIIYGWPHLRTKAFKRDNGTCAMCGYRPILKKWLNPAYQESNDREIKWYKEHDWFEKVEGDYLITNRFDDTQLIGDHIIPIAIGGGEFDLDNVQTLCIACNKIKTKQDIKRIAKFRRFEKVKTGGQTELKIY